MFIKNSFLQGNQGHFDHQIKTSQDQQSKFGSMEVSSCSSSYTSLCFLSCILVSYSVSQTIIFVSEISAVLRQNDFTNVWNIVAALSVKLLPGNRRMMLKVNNREQMLESHFKCSHSLKWEMKAPLVPLEAIQAGRCAQIFPF